MAKLYDGDRDVRRGAAEAITAALGPGLRTRAFVFNAILLDKSIDDRLRGYPTWISARNLSNETTDEAVQALIDAAVSRYDVPQRYYRLKARLLGLDRLSHYDRFAPVAQDTSKTSWDEAHALVAGAYADFSQEAGDVVEQFFTDRWIDAPVRPDKRHGAFCATTVPGVHPYVFMNYTGDRRSILTLAHELGHALHGSLAQPLGLYNASTPLTTAETASVFGEALTFKRLLAAEDEPRKRLDLLAGRIEDAIATTFRQIAMNRFEDAVHTERRQAGELAPERLAELWIAQQSALFGDSVSVDGYEPWWSYIPHFTGSPGYVYAYAYGYLFSLAIYRRYELEGDAMVEPYLALLRAGGSRSPEELAEIVGLDLSDPAIWASGIDALAEDLDAAEALAAEIGLT
jgi:oligoendopeptidase F